MSTGKQWYLHLSEILVTSEQQSLDHLWAEAVPISHQVGVTDKMGNGVTGTNVLLAEVCSVLYSCGLASHAQTTLDRPCFPRRRPAVVLIITDTQGFPHPSVHAAPR